MYKYYITPLSGPPEYSPVSIPGLQTWLDPADSSSFTQSGGSVSLIKDKSGNGNNFSQGVLTQQPTVSSINGVQAFNFSNPSSQNLQGNMAANIIANFSICALIYTTSNIDEMGIIADYTQNGSISLEVRSTNSVDIYATSGGALCNSGANTISTATPYMIAYTCNGAGAGTSTIYVNNVQKNSVSNGANTYFYSKNSAWGGDASWEIYFNGRQGDLAIYNVTLSPTDVDNLYNKFYKPKWGLP